MTEVQHSDHEEPVADGRSLRRIRNRARVVACYLELVAAGNRSPSIDDLARYSGLSFRSIYRYFDTPADLVAAAAAVPGPHRGDRHPTGSRRERIGRFVDERLELYERSLPFIAPSRSLHTGDERMASLVGEVRRSLLDELGARFAAELAGLDGEARRRREAAIYVAFLHDGLRLLHDVFPDDIASVRAVLVDHVDRHLPPAAALVEG